MTTDITNTSMLILFLAALAMVQSKFINCGPGVPVLRRLAMPTGGYELGYVCYCPIDYFGVGCREHRGLHCYLQTQQITPSLITVDNFEEGMDLTATVSAECYIQTNRKQYVPFVSYFAGRELGRTDISEALEADIAGMEVIWANDTNLVDGTGRVKYQEGYNFTLDEFGNKRMSKADEDIILAGSGPYQFTYNSSFLGFPMTASKFQVKPTIVMATKNSIHLDKQSLSLANAQQFDEYINKTISLKNNSIDTYRKKFNFTELDLTNMDEFNFQDLFKEAETIGSELSQLPTNPLLQCKFRISPRNQTEFGVLRAEIAIIEYYGGGGSSYIARTSVNSAQIRLPVRVSGVGEAVMYNKNFNKSTPRYVYFLAGGISLLVAYGIYLFYQQSRRETRRNIQRAVEAEEDQQLNQC